MTQVGPTPGRLCYQPPLSAWLHLQRDCNHPTARLPCWNGSRREVARSQWLCSCNQCIIN